MPVIAAVIVALAGGGFYAMQSKQGAAPPPKVAEGKDGKPVVDVYELSKGDIAAIEARALSIKLSLSGSLAPVAQATVKSKVSGLVMEANIREGMNVAAGQVIARLDQADASARVAQHQAMLEEATARLALATKNNLNSQALLKQNFISQSSVDATQNSVALAQASVKAARAQLDLARNARNDTVIRSPIAGVVSKRHVQMGEKLSPDMPVFTIVNLRQLTLDAQVPASDIPRVKLGQDVQFRVDGYPDRDFAGKVARINPITETGSRSMMVYINVDNADNALSGGMFAKGSITTSKSAVMPLLPTAALRKDQGSDMVYTIEGGKVVAQPVTLGMRNDDDGMAEVTAGLNAGATVIIGKLEGIKPGTKVKVAGAAPAAAQVIVAQRKG